jgi:phage shock protein PspC (stress-responsive transcriptional regulator)
MMVYGVGGVGHYFQIPLTNAVHATVNHQV